MGQSTEEGFEEEYKEIGTKGVALYGASLYGDGLSGIKMRTYEFDVGL